MLRVFIKIHENLNFTLRIHYTIKELVFLDFIHHTHLIIISNIKPVNELLFLLIKLTIKFTKLKKPGTSYIACVFRLLQNFSLFETAIPFANETHSKCLINLFCKRIK